MGRWRETERGGRRWRRSGKRSTVMLSCAQVAIVVRKGEYLCACVHVSRILPVAFSLNTSEFQAQSRLHLDLMREMDMDSNCPFRMPADCTPLLWSPPYGWPAQNWTGHLSCSLAKKAQTAAARTTKLARQMGTQVFIAPATLTRRFAAWPTIRHTVCGRPIATLVALTLRAGLIATFVTMTTSAAN